MSRTNYVGQEVEVLKGDLKGGKGTYLGTDGYTGRGVTCKLLIDNKPHSLLWDCFRFTDEDVQAAWDADDKLGELDFDR